MMNRAQLLAIMAAVPQDQLMSSLSRLMVNGRIAASKALETFAEAMAYRRTWIVKDDSV